MKYILPILLTIAVVVLGIMNYNMSQKVKNIAFVDAAYIFNNFKMKKELEVDFTKSKEFKQHQLDSLFDIVTIVKKSGDAEKVKMIENEFMYRKNAILEEQERLKVSFDSQIWNQLNGFMEEFGQQNKIDIILGANGGGSIMHGDSSLNVSQKFVDFANLKYSGK